MNTSVPATSPPRRGTSFRVRTAIYLFIVVMSVGVVIGVTLRFGTRVALEREVDLLLAEDSEELSQVLQSRNFDVDATLASQWNRRAAVHELHHWFIRVVAKDSSPLWETIGVPSDRPPIDDFPERVPHDWKEYRILQRPLPTKEEGAAVYLQIGTSLETLENDLLLLDRLLAGTLLLLCVIGPWSAWVLSGRLLEPLANLTRAAEKLEFSLMGDLLPLRGTGDELDRLTETINHLLAKVRQELQRREDWLANSAHQLRSPLAAISTNVEVVANRTTAPESKSMLQSVMEECTSLRTLVNKLLLLSEADADRLKPKHQIVDLKGIVLQALEIYEGLAIHHGVQLIIGRIDDAHVWGNAHYLRHTVQNLIDNAIKYTPSPGNVEVQLVSDSSVSQCEFIVKDTGMGISEKDLAKVTERFFRADSGRDPSATPRGSGLGLSICQSIIQGHGGQLRIESKLGEGTTAIVTLPLASASH